MSIKSITNSLLGLSFICIGFLVPSAAQAAVIINEVMYNPEGTDAGREWIELYNDGTEEVVLVAGSGSGSWRVADSSNHTLTNPQGGVGHGSLTIGAGGYLVVATDPAAFDAEFNTPTYSVIKSSLSLNNTGITVSLINGSGSAVDSVTYASSQGGNDNGTSLQRSGTEWIQALPTPGAANATESYTPPAKETTGSTSSGGSAGGSAKSPGYVTPPLADMFADIGSDRTVIVGADSKFAATSYDRNRDVIYFAKFLWNFGDGTTDKGPSVMHHFSYPGRYSVELVITNSDIMSRARITVTAEPASVVLSMLPQGGVSVKNESGRELDLSFWQVKQGGQVFALPEHSVVLKGSAINIAAKTLGFEATDARLYYPDNTEVLPVAAIAAGAPEQVPVPASSTPVSVSAAKPTPQEAAIAAPVSTTTAQASVATTTITPTQPEPAQLAASVAKSEQEWWLPVAGLGGLMGVGIASVWVVRRKPATHGPAEEFTIE